MEFEFRTTRPTGVLLGVSSQKMDGMGIEMIDEKVSKYLSVLSLHWGPHSKLWFEVSSLQESWVPFSHPFGPSQSVFTFITPVLGTDWPYFKCVNPTAPQLC